jgi:alkanesulfonate monooxygenase SsuD/methylene tetrahydromethanopterin reductase-like flavin-dependent oxidoreductase (luciferase family)
MPVRGGVRADAGHGRTISVHVACALYRHPVMTARLAADIDNLSGGRLVPGLGIGWDENEFANLGLPFPSLAQRHEALDETIAIVRGVWGEEPFTFTGRHFQTTRALVSPPPLQRPGPPLLIAGTGERRTLRQVAEEGDACGLFQIDLASGDRLTDDDIRHKLTVLHRHCESLGRPYDSVLRTYGTGWTILAGDEERLAEKLRRYFPNGMAERYTGAWRNWVFAATPERATAHFRALAEAGIQYFVVETLDAADEETIQLLATDVIPHVAR